MKQVITVGKDGSLFGLDHKRKGLDLAKLGKAQKERVSDIRWNEGWQVWYVQFLKVGPYANEGCVVCDVVLQAAGLYIGQLKGARYIGDVPCFDDYEDAVAAEVAVLQGLQQRGMFNA